tara:strand:+ start:860 stop:1330 length:471 start_codon:yes stop_codon:yes gene_type:complete
MVLSDFEMKLEFYGNPELRKFITAANKKIRIKIAEEVKEEKSQFSADIKKKRLAEKMKRIIAVPKGAKREEILKLMVKHSEHFNDIKPSDMADSDIIKGKVKRNKDNTKFKKTKKKVKEEEVAEVEEVKEEEVKEKEAPKKPRVKKIIKIKPKKKT